MTSTAEIWDRVATLPPGPDLAAVLASVPWEQIPNTRVDEVAAVWARQRAHAEGELMAGLVHVARSTPVYEDTDELVERADRSAESAVSEIAAALTWTVTAAARELRRAEVLHDHLPLVLAAMRQGRVDRTKAYLFSTYLDPAELTTEQIATVCQRVLPLAAGWTSKQLANRLKRELLAIDPTYRRRRYERAVRDRGVSLYLDPHTGTATLAADGLPPEEAAAACARLDRLAAAARRAGCPGRLGQISADLFTGMLDGTFHGLTEAEIIEALRARLADVTEDIEPVTEPGTTGTQPLREGIEIRAGLPTLLGHDELPGEIPGLGPVSAEDARRAITAQQRGAEWRFAIIDGTRHLLLGGLLRRRPRGPGGRVRGGVVELTITPAELEHELADAANSAWAGVLGEIAAHWARRHQKRPDNRDPRRRFARGALARHVQMRDRHCIGPGCDRPARRCDLDHTLDHGLGGDTVEDNIGPGCTWHHHDKDRGWTVSQPEPGLFHWRSPLGRHYWTRGEPLRHDLPEAQPPEPGADTRWNPDPPDDGARAAPLQRPPPTTAEPESEEAPPY